MPSTPNPAATQLGFWSSVSIAVLFIVFTLCFVAIAATQPLFRWTNLADYVAYATSHDQFFQNLARLSMLLFGPAYIILLASIHDRTHEEMQIWTRLALCFGVAFATLTGIHYFVQLSAVRLSLAHGELQGLDQIVQANPTSAISAINMLGWTLFLGLSSIFVAQVFSGSRLERAIRIALLINGVCCLVGSVGYVLDIVALVFVTINFGMGGAVLIAAILLSVWFKRLGRMTQSSA